MTGPSTNLVPPALKGLAKDYSAVRNFSAQLCESLEPEDCVIQSMPDASPIRWHLAHTTWFFETFLLRRDPSYRSFNECYEVLFNSYYNSVGEQFPRPRRGLLSRPTVDEVFAYRDHVDACIGQLIHDGQVEPDADFLAVLELGLHHEQQHQELMLTDIKHLFSCNPLLPTFRAADSSPTVNQLSAQQWVDFPSDIYLIGFAGDGFAYDNEGPQHRVLLEPFQIASRPTTCGEYLEFIQDDGYRRPELWLSLGWTQLQQDAWRSPLYWFKRDDRWMEFTLAGPRPLDLAAPVTHVSYFEADAFARWAKARLPTEAEWEVAAESAASVGSFADQQIAAGRALHPEPCAAAEEGLSQMLGDVWEWTASPYTAYPGYRPAAGALGEYNGKFMCNQFVLRGGSIATSKSHIRPTYRNFFPPEARWQFSGIRLARDND